MSQGLAAFVAGVAAIVATVAGSIAYRAGSGAAFAIVIGAGTGIALLLLAQPKVGVAALDHLLVLRRRALWGSVEGKYHRFGNIGLAIDDDGRHVWVAAADLQRALRSTEADDVIAARHAGRWRRTARGGLQLRVDAVVQVLATAPGRMDPHTVRLRRYLEREVLFPAARRRERRGVGTG